jgi:hypothetical protein
MAAGFITVARARMGRGLRNDDGFTADIKPSAIRADGEFQRPVGAVKGPDVEDRSDPLLVQFVALGEVAPECDQVGLLEARSEHDDQASRVELVDQIAGFHQPQGMMDRRVHRGENERRLLQPGRQRRGEQERVLIALVLMEVMLGQGDGAEAACIGVEGEVGQAVEKRKFVFLVVNSSAEVHAEFHGSASHPLFLSNRTRRPPLPQVTALSATFCPDWNVSRKIGTRGRSGQQPAPWARPYPDRARSSPTVTARSTVRLPSDRRPRPPARRLNIGRQQRQPHVGQHRPRHPPSLCGRACYLSTHAGSVTPMDRLSP